MQQSLVILYFCLREARSGMSSFSKSSFPKCSPSAIKRKAPFSSQISADGPPNRRNIKKLRFPISPTAVVWTGPQSSNANYHYP